MAADLLRGSTWECTSTAPEKARDPEELASLELDWVPAHVPGTAAGTMRQVVGFDSDSLDYDARDWWFRTSFPSDGAPCTLGLGGLATIADVWCNAHHVLHSENMFLAHDLPVATFDGPNQLVIRFAALKTHLSARRPRPRWRSLAVPPGLRWIRTSLIGRVLGWTLTPPVVGPWRPVTLHTETAPRLVNRSLRSTCDGPDGLVEVEVRLTGDPTLQTATAVVGTSSAELLVERRGPEVVLSGSVRVADVERWWPKTHGDQPLYSVHVTTDGAVGELGLGRVGFRTISLDTTQDGFRFIVNDEAVFCRGATWWPIDPVSMTTSDEAMRGLLELATRGHLNMVRVSAMAVYESERFFELCDELGILVWQDLMLAFNDLPNDEEFVDGITREVKQNLAPLSGHCSLALVCGSQQVEEMAALMGMDPEDARSPLIEECLRDVVAGILPDIPYIHTCPTGGSLPFHVNAGPSNYFGVGLYLRSPEDARMAGVRFASECLFLATPPDPATIDELCGGVLVAGHRPRWKSAIHFDPGRSWDMEDLRDYYVEELFDVNVRKVRYEDPERALDYGRACNAELVHRVFSQWRRAGSDCAGGLVLGLRDQRPGPGWGLVDFAGRPKSTWYALARVSAPVALLTTDEGLNGLALHVVNDTDRPLQGELRIDLYADTRLLEQGQTEIRVPARASASWSDSMLLGGFRDVNWAYRFSAPNHDAAVATLTDQDGVLVGQAFEFPSGVRRPMEADLGLQASFAQSDDGWTVEITTERLAQWVVPIVDGYLPGDAWFHMAPGDRRSIALLPFREHSEPPNGIVRAFNSKRSHPIGPPHQT